MLQKRNLLWILFFGTLIGLSETFLGSFSLISRSVVLGSITLILLALARYMIRKPGTSLLIIAIAVLFKVNSTGIQSCDVNFFLCGPTALMLIGIFFEIFASLFISKDSFKYLSYALACSATAVMAFTMFGVMDTFILKVWDTAKLMEYIFLKSTLTAIISSTLSIFGLYVAVSLKNYSYFKAKSWVGYGVLSVMIIALWLFGTFTTV